MVIFTVMNTETITKLKPTFDKLVDKHSREIFAYLWRLIGNDQDAEDCLQDTFLRAFKAYPRLDEQALLEVGDLPRQFLDEFGTLGARANE